jgi:imidazolonepropionase-like amidohydrolase
VFEQNGKLEEGKDADVLVLRKENLEIKDVVSGGWCSMKSGKLAFKEKFLEVSNRHIKLDGEK